MTWAPFTVTPTALPVCCRSPQKWLSLFVFDVALSQANIFFQELKFQVGGRRHAMFSFNPEWDSGFVDWGHPAPREDYWRVKGGSFFSDENTSFDLPREICGLGGVEKQLPLPFLPPRGCVPGFDIFYPRHFYLRDKYCKRPQGGITSVVGKGVNFLIKRRMALKREQSFPIYYPAKRLF